MKKYLASLLAAACLTFGMTGVMAQSAAAPAEPAKVEATATPAATAPAAAAVEAAKPAEAAAPATPVPNKGDTA
ncbi:MAG: hypothetical protein ACK50W_00565, partial [bacterium]